MYDGFLARILEPDIFLPSQFCGTGGLSRQLEGEKRLMIAILKDALECLTKYAARRVVQDVVIIRMPWSGSRIKAPIGFFRLIISAIFWDSIPTIFDRFYSRKKANTRIPRTPRSILFRL
jgi:hypothetical protein